MTYLPSARVHELLRAEQTGVWIDRAGQGTLWMVAKAPMYTARAIELGCSVAFRLWVVEFDGRRVAAFGLTIQDNTESPLTIYGACRSLVEVSDLRALLEKGKFPLQVHNEVFLPVLQCQHCQVEIPDLPKVVDLLGTGVGTTQDEVELRQRALDVIDDSLDVEPTTCSELVLSESAEIRFQHVVRLQSTVLSSRQTFSIDDPDQGNEFERLGLLAFDHLCPDGGTIHQPRVQIGGKLRELCDVLALNLSPECDHEGVFVVQSKVSSADETSLARTNDRWASSIEKNILAAIRQLSGAIRHLKNGTPVLHEDGTPFAPPGLEQRIEKGGHGIALVSEMHSGVDWQKVTLTALAAVRKTQFMVHVLDLRELQRLVTYSNDHAALLDYYLIQRFERIVEVGTVFMRSEFTSNDG